MQYMDCVGRVVCNTEEGKTAGGGRAAVDSVKRRQMCTPDVVLRKLLPQGESVGKQGLVRQI